MRASIIKLQTALESVVFGQSVAIRQTLIAFLAGGHVLLEGVPGVGKTRLARTLAEMVGGEYKRVQFTPDLMPSDIVGNAIFRPDEGRFEIQQGPVFCNVLLADEINRTPPKTQAALLEAMAERRVSIYGETRTLPRPFFVIATQNPIEYEGTYTLPEAQLDRFLMQVNIGYPDAEAELQMLQQHTVGEWHEAAASLVEPDALQAALAEVGHVSVSDDILRYIVRLVDRTRQMDALQLGASPRAATALLDAARAVAFLEGRAYVIPDDILEIAEPVLQHRLLLGANATLEGIRTYEVVQQLVQQVEAPR